jgi:hypothetical protein
MKLLASVLSCVFLCGCAGNMNFEFLTNHKALIQSPDKNFSCYGGRCCWPWRSHLYVCTEPNPNILNGAGISINFRPEPFVEHKP